MYQMETRPGSARQRLVLRFALGALAVFLVTSLGISFLMIRNVRARAESVATFHAQFVTNSVLAPALQGLDLTEPFARNERDALNVLVKERILSDDRDLRVKIWRFDGTVVFSDESALIGRRFPSEQTDLRLVASGEVISGISDLEEAENVFERNLADKLFFTYVPLRESPAGPVVAVVEVYQRYAVIQAEIDTLVRTLTITFGLGLLLMYAGLLPIVMRASRTLRTQNQRLREQTQQLNVLLEREQQTVSELRDLSQKKSDFVAAASHELRTPLTAILGYITTLQRPEFSNDPAARAEFLGAAEQQTTRLVRLITNLLGAAHLEDGTRPILSEPFELEVLTRDALSSVGQRRDRVRSEVPADFPPLQSDTDRIREILTNLLDNALKYSPDGGEIVVGAIIEEDVLRIWVRDRGVGIEPSEHERIFDRFYQVDQSSTRLFSGVGLGLHLSRAMARDLGGDLTVESSPGHGSTFTLSIPAIPAIQGSRGSRPSASVHA
jgi:signal transduction histidine kinase